MICLITGTQLPFDRLVTWVDDWASDNRGVEIIAQIGVGKKPRNLKSEAFFEPCELESKIHESDFVVAHAGMGTILQCLELGKRVLIIPRKENLGEHRNDHQVSTALHLKDVPNVFVASSEAECRALLNQLSQEREAPSPATKQFDTSAALLNILKNQIRDHCPDVNLTRPRIMGIASGGGHWTQLSLLAIPFQGEDLRCLTTRLGDPRKIPFAQVFKIVDANRNTPLKGAAMAVQILLSILKHRPHIIFSTGAAPGYLAIRLGKLLGARTIWIDSVANCTQLSMSGKLAGKYTDLWITQWPQLSSMDGPSFYGSVLGDKISLQSTGGGQKTFRLEDTEAN